MSATTEHVLLPVAEPPINGYQFYALPLAIHATDQRTRDWVLSNFIALAYDRRGEDCDVPFCFYLHDFALSPWLETVRLNRYWFDGTDVVEELRALIRRGYYVYTFVDERLVPDRQAFGGDDAFPHDVLVHGFDSGRGTFTLLGFDDRFRFRTTEVDARDLAKAYHALDGTTFEERQMDDTPFVLWRVRSTPDHGFGPVAYELDLALIARTVAEHLESRNSSDHFRMLRAPFDCAFGMETYGMLADYLDGYCEGRHLYDVRHLHVLWEHKRLMVDRVARLAEVDARFGRHLDAAEVLERSAQSLRNAFIRQSLRPDPTAVEGTWRSQLDTVEAHDHSLAEALLQTFADMGVAGDAVPLAWAASDPSTPVAPTT